jgi:hypothetical protein
MKRDATTIRAMITTALPRSTKRRRRNVLRRFLDEEWIERR